MSDTLLLPLSSSASAFSLLIWEVSLLLSSPMIFIFIIKHNQSESMDYNVFVRRPMFSYAGSLSPLCVKTFSGKTPSSKYIYVPPTWRQNITDFLEKSKKVPLHKLVLKMETIWMECLSHWSSLSNRQNIPEAIYMTLTPIFLHHYECWHCQRHHLSPFLQYMQYSCLILDSTLWKISQTPQWS